MPAVVATVLVMSWSGAALAKVTGTGDGFDGDELDLPIIVGIGVLAYFGLAALRLRSRKSP
jgi:hypothetical protein